MTHVELGQLDHGAADEAGAGRDRQEDPEDYSDGDLNGDEEIEGDADDADDELDEPLGDDADDTFDEDDPDLELVQDIALRNKEQAARSLAIRRALEQRMEQRRLNKDIDYLDYDLDD